jgi:C4-dicarboxylate transporter DctM subunit
MLAITLIISMLMLLSGTPIFIAFSIGGFLWCLLYLGLPFEAISQIFFWSINKYTLLAVPFFMIAGSLMGETGIVSAIVNSANSIFGRIRGVLGASLVSSCAFMGTLTGSNVATVTTMMETMVPILDKVGYPKQYSCGVLSTSGSIATMIPPCTNAVLFGYVTEMSVGKLFMAGLLPGLLATVILGALAVVIARYRNYGSVVLSISWRERGRSLLKVLPATLVPIVVLGSIYSGFLVATEAGLVACGMTLLVGIIFYKRLSFSEVLAAIRRSLIGAANVYLLIGSAQLLGYLLIYLRVPHIFTETLVSFGVNYWAFVFICIFIFLALGLVLDPAVMVIVIVPILMPSVEAMAMDPYVFYILENCLVSIGQVTPPVAIVLYVMSGLSGVSISTILKESWPFIVGLISVIIITVLFPPLATYIPSVMR